jgi:hypothetical protein
MVRGYNALTEGTERCIYKSHLHSSTIHNRRRWKGECDEMEDVSRREEGNVSGTGLCLSGALALSARLRAT